MFRHQIAGFILMIGMICSCQLEVPEAVSVQLEKLPADISFSHDVKPILSDKCFACHGPDQNKLEAELRLDIEDIAKSVLPSGHRAVVASNTGRSHLIDRILSESTEDVMPPPESNLILSEKEKAILIKWIEDGANYEPHWAFTKPAKLEIEEAKNSNDISPIDQIISKKLKDAGLEFNQEADKSLLLRRVSFDITGLPPTVDEIDKFLDDNSATAYEQQVDRLLSSIHYGERMAVDWMDVARFADTHGYQSDRFRDMSPWRDWVIESFNANMPYDKFVTWQLAGDLLDEPTKEQRLATAFLRLHPQNEEGGIVEEEFKVEYVADRVHTVSTAFMGLTFSCAKCHDHKYDPISQKEYYQLFSFFNNVNEAGQISFDGAMPVPTMQLTDEKTDSIIAFIENEITDLKNKKANAIQNIEPGFNQWLETEKYQSFKTSSNTQGLQAYFNLDGSLRDSQKRNRIGEMKRHASKNEVPGFVTGKMGEGLLLDGDAWLDLKGAGAFQRHDAFNISLWVKLPEELVDGVIFHKGTGAALYNFKGFHLALKDNKLELMMAAVAPYNAIIEYAEKPVPRNEWIHFSLDYDGHSSAEGLKVYMNGEELKTSIRTDNLYKDIVLKDQGEPVGIQLGARWRGKGIGKAVVDEVKIYDRSLSELEIRQLSNQDDFENVLNKDVAELDESDLILLKDYYLRQNLNPADRINVELYTQYKALNELTDTLQEVMVMDEMSTPRQSYILDRGQYDSPTEEVHPQTPSSILSYQDDLPKNRLGLAQWLLNEDHPLTARVVVNRYWQLFFGNGIVETTEDFGNQGSLPTQQELLDWLAIDFRESGWDVKALVKKIAMSKAYRQSSIPNAESLEIDPDNKLYSYGPSGRLSAEMIRDNVLAASGLLDRRIGGPSVYPYQPDGLWGMLSNRKYPEATEVDLYRRSLYTIWKRTVPHPTQATFDSPERSECMVRRQETNTPLQALAMMNDKVYLDAAKKLSTEKGNENLLQFAFQKLTGRSPNDQEQKILKDMYLDELSKNQNNQSRAKSWADNELKNSAEVASYAVVISTIINTDAAIVKR